MIDRRSAIFLDRDGTIIEEVNYLSRPEQVHLLYGVGDVLNTFSKMGYLLVVVTNQSGLARGYFNEAELKKIHDRMAELLEQRNVKIDAVYHCPHHIDGIIPEYKIRCNCRKPAPGMWFQAAKDLDIDLGNSWTIGDKLIDLQAGDAAGTKVLMVETGYGREERLKLPSGWISVPDMTAALDYIVRYRNENL
ncbi:HAD family hydrolase [Pelotomaculum isophthalicicum JI]|uniref:D,D-heptose 1,7-bisphosphate phosphatase n=1 Tax=Pelotomaculum isophthalicicum JI TaxID=947010 RepID=A0A9X4GYJ7_9FIRM|nr:HAD family hydrolase [Pelotomaculum isophthalicicum]MDF9407895.1 HAD family hydrolase [Pelotomaculum isophthalicicum JI]